MVSKTELKEMFTKASVLKFGQFITKSGRPTTYFFNLGEVYSSDHLDLLIRAYADRICEKFPQVTTLFGPAYKGIPIVSALCLEVSKQLGRNVSFAYNRKEQKTHGEGGSLVGDPMKKEGTKVVIVDDVLTAGTSSIQSIELIKSIPIAEVLGLVVAMDRCEAAAQSSELANSYIRTKFGIGVEALLSLQDIS